MLDADEKNSNKADSSFAVDNSKIEESFISPENIILKTINGGHLTGRNKLTPPISGGLKNQNIINVTDRDKTNINISIEKKSDQSKIQKDREEAIQRKQIAIIEEKNNEIENENLNERTQKLLSSKGNNRQSVICQFTFVALIFVFFFVINYIVEILYLKNLQIAHNHLQLISSRSPNIRFANLFMLEEIVQNNSFMTFSGIFHILKMYHIFKI